MLSRHLGVLERRLGAHLAKLANKRLGRTITMIEVVDVAGLWTDTAADLAPMLSGMAFDELLNGFPILGCAAASEIGFRYEGVGTVFWARFEGLLGRDIPMSQRSLLAQSFARLAGRFALQKPSDAGFATQFSIIAWPIANALMPYDLAGPVSRLLARGPVSAVAAAANGRRGDLSSLRAWAQSWEGARLVDWLQQDGPAFRVIGALLSDNAAGNLAPASYARVNAAFAHQSEAFFSLRDAKRRKSSSIVSIPDQPGQLSLHRYGAEYVLSVTWTPLPQVLVDRGRQQASARGWRPRLWGQARTAADNLFGSLPISLRLATLPSGCEPAVPDADSVFDDDLELRNALLGRIVNWESPLIFLGDGEQADQIEVPFAATDGILWILDRDAQLPGVPAVGSVAGVVIRRADLAQPTDRDALASATWLKRSSTTATQIARSPRDTLMLSRREVTAQSPIWIFDGSTWQIERLQRKDSGLHGLSVRSPAEATGATPGVFLFEREAAFDALGSVDTSAATGR